MASPAAAPRRPVLVLYASADAPFVCGFLVPALGPAGDGEQVVEARDLATIASADLERALDAGGVTIAVISAAFLADPWSRLSELLISSAALERKLEVVPLVLEDCRLPLHIKTKVRLDFVARNRWDREAARLRDYLARPAPVDPPLPCPYPGMRPFEAGDLSYFHGRKAEIEAVIALLAAGERELYLVGPSGSGKSSLMRAGVLPRLAALPGTGELVVRTMRPGDAPVRGLAACLDIEAGVPPDAAAIAAWMARHPGSRLLLFVDQLEELFNLAPASEQLAFAAALRALRDQPCCVLVLAVRADFYAELLESQLWLDGMRRHVDLPPLRGPELRAAIEQPARALDVYLEPELTERLLADAAGEPGVLPLLQETLVQLWGKRRRRLLTLAEYQALGKDGYSGLAVAISSRADRCLHDMTPAQAALARRLLLRLVSFGEGRPNTRRRQTRAQLGGGESAAELDGVLRQLVAARLVMMDGDDRSDDDQVDLCHEALITAWPSFAAWVGDRRADEQRRRNIQASADEWVARGRGVSGLLDEAELAAAIAWRRTDAARELGETAAVTALIDASGAALSRSRRRRRRWIASAGASLVAVAVVTATLAVIAQSKARLAEARLQDANEQRQNAEVQRQNAVHERQIALHRLGEQYRDLGRQALVDGYFYRALPYLVAARERGVDEPGLRTLFKMVTASELVTSVPHGGPISSVDFSADGTRIITASIDGTARVWDAASGAPLTPPLVHPAAVLDAKLAPDATRVVTISRDNAARIWDVASSTPSSVVLPHAGRVTEASFSGDGSVVVTASADHTARVWNARTGSPIGPALEHDDDLKVEVSRDGSRVVTIVNTGAALGGIWNARTGARIAPLRWSVLDNKDDWGRPARVAMLVWSALFNADGTRIVTASDDDTVRVWNAETGALLKEPLIRLNNAKFATFSPDGTRIATVSLDRRVRIWDAISGAPAGPTIESPAQVDSIRYSRDGTRLLSHDADMAVRIWDAVSGRLVIALDLDTATAFAALSPDGRRFITAGADGVRGVARVWKVPQIEGRVVDGVTRPKDAAYSPDGAHIAVLAENGLWLLTASGAIVGEMREDPSIGFARLVFDHDGRQLAAISLAGSAIVGDVASMRLEEFPFDRDYPRDRGSDTPGRYVPVPARGAFSPDGRRFATVFGENGARIWDTASREPVMPPLLHAGVVTTARFSPDGRRVLTASTDGTARRWDAETGAPIEPPLIHVDPCAITSAVFSPDGTRIATVGTDDKVYLWDAESGSRQAVLAGHGYWVEAAVFSPDGALLVTYGRDLSARIWRVATGALAAPPLKHADWVLHAAFSPDGTRVVTSSGELVQLWDAETGRPLGQPLPHPDVVHAALFSPDGSSLLTVGHTALRIWDVEPDRRTLEQWQRIADRSAAGQIGKILHHPAPATPAGAP